MNKLRHILFDFDDTLVHTFEKSYALHTEIAREMGAFVPSREEFKAVSHRPWEHMIEHFWPGEHERFRNAFIPNNRLRTSIMPELVDGALATLELLRGMYGIHLLTHRDGNSLAQALEALKLKDYFATIHPLESLPSHKPHPAVFGNVLKKLDGACLYVGDGIADFQAARGAGIGFAGVLTGATNREDFLSAGLEAGRIIKSVKYLPSFLKGRIEVER